MLGGAMLAFYLFQYWSPAHIPFVLYLVASIGVIAVASVAIVRARWRPLPDALSFGLGDGLTFSLFAAVAHVVAGQDALQAAATGAIFLLLFAFLIRAVWQRPQGSTPTTE